MSLLVGKVVLVTGASRGIGAQTAEVLAEHGAVVAVNYAVNAERAQAVVANILANGGTAFAIAGDVRDEAEVDAMVATILDRHERIDGVVNNAVSGAQHGHFQDATWAGYQNMIDFGAKAVVNTVRAVRSPMRAQGGGSIVNIVTELWNMGSAEWSMYLAGKGAMVGISRSLAAELGPEGIRINMIAPGWMATEQIDRESEGSRGFAASLPLRRHGTGHEIGKVAAFYLSDLSSYCTGTYLPVCGGRVTQVGV
jgi:3-oxoacyl-[acyl-carrier protein] reductase